MIVHQMKYNVAHSKKTVILGPWPTALVTLGE